MNKEDIRLLPLAAFGIAKGVLEYIIKPKIVDEAQRIKVATAAIYFYSTNKEKRD